jgi:hypothetical protein
VDYPAVLVAAVVVTPPPAELELPDKEILVVLDLDLLH